MLTKQAVAGLGERVLGEVGRRWCSREQPLLSTKEESVSGPSHDDSGQPCASLVCHSHS